MFLLVKVIECDKYVLLRFPIPPLTKVYKTVIEWKIFSNNTKREDQSEYERRKEDLQDLLAKQIMYTSISMILEAALEAGFQFWFQTIYYLPTLVQALMDISGADRDLQDVVDWKIVSIILSFLTFSLTSFNIR